ncbi:MAG: DUF2130 domain-containing protein [Verrucomicrobia bacterium]|nr:DUF2130 domain-containing protein [Verrucomicrobiota bacterium]MDA1069365.1 DUF2130 domain-containing protein [Verrucomicrobiota bacterium]
MNEISCPHCGKAFKVDETGYADILKQVRDHEFEEQLKERLQLAEKDKANELALAEEKLNRKFQSEAQKKDSKIQVLKSQLESGKTQLELVVAKAVAVVEKERDQLANQLQQAKADRENESKLAKVEKAKELQEASAQKEKEIQELKSQLEAKEVSQKLAITEAVSVVEKERDQLKHNLEQSTLQKEVSEKALKDKYETQIKDRGTKTGHKNGVISSLLTKIQ